MTRIAQKAVVHRMVMPSHVCPYGVKAIDPRFDRATGILHVNAVYAEDGAPADAGAAFKFVMANAGENPRALWIRGGMEFAAPPPVDELDRTCLDRIARYKRPRDYEVRAELPRTESGSSSPRTAASFGL